MKIKIDKIGGDFKKSTNMHVLPKYFDWVEDKSGACSVYIDKYIYDWPLIKKDKKTKFAYLPESANINTTIYGLFNSSNFINFVERNFEYIITHNLDVINSFKCKNLVYCPPPAMPFLDPAMHGIHKKDKLISMISSVKTITPVQKQRNNLANHLDSNKIADVFGVGRKQINCKSIGLRDYMFSICVENGTIDGEYTEKLSDVIASGAIPIYYGANKSVNDFFDSNGIIFLDSLDVSYVTTLIKNLSETEYLSRINSIKNNYKILKQKVFLPEDYIFENYISKYV